MPQWNSWTGCAISPPIYVQGLTPLQESVPAALTKDKKRIHDEEIAVHLAWQSTLYVTNFPEHTDDKFIRDLFEKVRALQPLRLL